MKKTILYLFIGLVSSILVVSCSKDDDDSHDFVDADAIPEIEETAKIGEWMVSSYKINDTDLTRNYNSFTFTFDEGDVVSAISEAETILGSWSLKASDDEEPHAFFYLDFDVLDTHVIDALNYRWDVVEFSDTVIELCAKNDDDTELYYLIFTRN